MTQFSDQNKAGFWNAALSAGISLHPNKTKSETHLLIVTFHPYLKMGYGCIANEVLDHMNEQGN